MQCIDRRNTAREPKLKIRKAKFTPAVNLLNFPDCFYQFVPRNFFLLLFFYLLPGCSNSWAQQPFHQFFLQHDGIHPKPFQHWRIKNSHRAQNVEKHPSSNEKKIWGLETSINFSVSLSCLCSLNMDLSSLYFPPFDSLSFLFSLSSSFLPSARQQCDSPCSDRYGGILTEREGNRESE